MQATVNLETGIVLSCNNKLAVALGYAAGKEITGQHFSRFLWPNDRIELLPLIFVSRRKRLKLEMRHASGQKAVALNMAAEYTETDAVMTLTALKPKSKRPKAAAEIKEEKDIKDKEGNDAIPVAEEPGTPEDSGGDR
jgi:hypothetical protein